MSGPAARAGWKDEDGLLATPVLFVVWSGLLVAIAVVDVGAYLVAAGRAQAAADAAALAAVSLDVEAATTPPALAARTVARRNRGELESCTCRIGSGLAEVGVSVAVDGLFIPRVTGARRVTATARAELAASLPTSGPATDPAPTARAPPSTSEPRARHPGAPRSLSSTRCRAETPARRRTRRWRGGTQRGPRRRAGRPGPTARGGPARR